MTPAEIVNPASTAAPGSAMVKAPGDAHRAIGAALLRYSDLMGTWRPPDPPIGGDRIRVRLPTPSDAATLHRYALADGGFEGVWLPLAAGASVPECTSIIDDWLAGWRNEPSYQGPALANVDPDKDDLIGQIGLGDRGEGVAELVYGIAPDHRGRGYASAATRLVADWLLS